MRSCYGATVADAVAAAVSGAAGDMVSGQHKCHVVVRKGDVQIPRAGAHCEPLKRRLFDRDDFAKRHGFELVEMRQPSDEWSRSWRELWLYAAQASA